MIHHELVGDSEALADVIGFIEKAAPADSTVLIQGESGTGKELVARAIHRNSPRADRPFVATNCATLMESLAESELFGHERGAFSGAILRKKGKMEVAHGGTLFLDEIGELALPVQAKLLRVLQEREFERVGGTKAIQVDIRLIAATNRELEAAAAAGRFRPDLYYRVNVLFLRTPPLRERREDIPVLARHFILEYARRRGAPVRAISAEADAILWKYDWPGNVRQLQNVMEHAMVLGPPEFIFPRDLPPYLLGSPSQTLDQAVLRVKREFARQIVELVNGNLQEAAAILGIHPKGIQRFLSRLDLSYLAG